MIADVLILVTPARSLGHKPGGTAPVGRETPAPRLPRRLLIEMRPAGAVRSVPGHAGARARIYDPRTGAFVGRLSGFERRVDDGPPAFAVLGEGTEFGRAVWVTTGAEHLDHAKATVRAELPKLDSHWPRRHLEIGKDGDVVLAGEWQLKLIHG